MGAHSSHHEPLDRSSKLKSFRRVGCSRQSKSKGASRPIDRLRHSFHRSFRRFKGAASEVSKPYLWQADEMDVRAGICFFHVKYLGCVEVYESRGMQVCEEALLVLKSSRKRSIKAILHVSGDGLRVVEVDSRGLIVDQTIEKVSFCAPDRTHSRVFSYICRDGTTRRWLCHGFLALKDTGEHLSHAVGCAFAVCLERKQKRDKECSVTMSFDLPTSTFTRTGSFRQQSVTKKSQDTSMTATTPIGGTHPATTVININNNIHANYKRKDVVPLKTTLKINTSAIERPRATMSLLRKQGSFRAISLLNHTTPFKRRLSIQVDGDLSITSERNRSLSAESIFDPKTTSLSSTFTLKSFGSNILEHLDGGFHHVSPITEQVNKMCQQLSQELSLFTRNDDLLSLENAELKSLRPALSDVDTFGPKILKSSQSLINEPQPATYSTLPTPSLDFELPSGNSVFDKNIENLQDPTPPLETMLPDVHPGTASVTQPHSLESNSNAERDCVRKPTTLPNLDSANSEQLIHSLAESKTDTKSPSSVPIKVEAEISNFDAFNTDWVSFILEDEEQNEKSFSVPKTTENVTHLRYSFPATDIVMNEYSIE